MDEFKTQISGWWVKKVNKYENKRVNNQGWKKKNVGWVGGWIHGWTKIKVSTWMKTCEWKLMSNVEK